jgi:hypothetical protein
MAAAVILTACVAPSRSAVPHREVAYAVSSLVKTETSLNSACFRAAVLVVTADISARLRETGGREDLVVARSRWDSLECPDAAVPGLSFGAADAARTISAQMARARS